jgi:quercetin dioxygenase-like cupin family protein
MRTVLGLALAALGLAALPATAQTASRSDALDTMSISRQGTRSVQPGPAAQFTGTVRVEMLFAPTDTTRGSGARVTFGPGARSAWHTHPRGQTLVVTAGIGRIQRRGGTVEEIRAGDVVWTPPGVEHWHGADPTTAMSHLAIQETLNGSNVTWGAKVTEAEYGPEESRMWMTVGNRRFAISLADNATARALVARLPLTLEMEELNGNEKHAQLEQPLPANASRPGTIHAGDLMLYSTSTLVVFYETFGSNYAYMRLGRVDDPAGLAGTLGRGDVRVVFSKD